MDRIYKAPSTIPSKFEDKILFLGGPIQGAWTWQEYVSLLLIDNTGDVVIANPRRDNLHDKKFDYNEQVEWETKYLKKAIGGSGLFFWLPKQHEVIPGRSYAQTTRFEMGEWYARRKESEFNFFVGIEEGLEGSRYITKKFEDIGVKVHTDLDEMIGYTINTLNKS